MAKKTEIRITRKVQPGMASCCVPKRSTWRNLTDKALTITANRNKEEKMKIHNSKEHKKVVKEVIAIKEVRKRSEKDSLASMGNGSSTSMKVVL